MPSSAWSGPPQVAALREDGTVDPARAEGIPDELAVALYEQMVLSREADAHLVALQRQGRIAHHASAHGEEAAIVGAAAAVRDEDWMFLASRDFAAALWRGMPLAALMHHAFGTSRAPGKGRAAQSPPFWKPARVVSTSPLSGTQVLHAAGVAWAARARKEDRAALVFFGEGATSTADFHAGLNFAGVTRSPLVAVCRNNGWATTTPADRQTASDGFAVKAVAYGVRAVRVDGADIVAVFGVVREARARASAGEGCTLIEAVTSPRAQGDSDDSWSARDPLARMRRHLERRGLWGEDRDAQLRADVREDVRRAIEEAVQAAGTPAADLVDDVYAHVPWHLREQRDAMTPGGVAAGG
jgi:pyruvate dehydrogenase E1 component alpha subunit